MHLRHCVVALPTNADMNRVRTLIRDLALRIDETGTYFDTPTLCIVVSEDTPEDTLAHETYVRGQIPQDLVHTVILSYAVVYDDIARYNERIGLLNPSQRISSVFPGEFELTQDKEEAKIYVTQPGKESGARATISAQSFELAFHLRDLWRDKGALATTKTKVLAREALGLTSAT